MSNLKTNYYYKIIIEWIIFVQLGDIPNIQTFVVKYRSIFRGTKKRWNLVLKKLIHFSETLEVDILYEK